MAAIVTDQFRLNNTNNFINSVEDTSNSFYIFLGLPNPNEPVFGRDENWEVDQNGAGQIVPVPIDNFSYLSHYKDTILFGKRVNSSNVRRIVRRINWTKGTKYDMYRHDYSATNLSSVSRRSRLYDANYFVLTSDFKMYICLENGSSGDNPGGNASQDEPSFTDLEPSRAGESGDGYIWKYLFTLNPSDIVKFDSTEYVTLPSNWSGSTDSQIVAVRENADSTQNNNQIKTIYIDSKGSGYVSGEVNINGDGSGGKAFIEVDSSGSIVSATVTSGGSGYTYGIVDLGSIQPALFVGPDSVASLIPIIPPSLGHGYDLYRELGADRVLLYSRFDDSSRDFPTSTKFSQIGILKNPQKFLSDELFEESRFSSLYSFKFSNVNEFTPQIGEKISQQLSTGSIAIGYVASYDPTARVMKYFRDRSLYYGDGLTNNDYVGVSTSSKIYQFGSSIGDGSIVGNTSGFSGTIDTNFTGISTSVDGQIIDLDSLFTNGLSNPEINTSTGDVIYIDNRPLVGRSSRQKEDVKIILEF